MTPEQMQINDLVKMLGNVNSRTRFLETGRTKFSSQASHDMLLRYIMRVEQIAREDYGKLL